MKTMCQDLNQVGLFLIIFGHLLCWLRDGQKCIDRSLAGDKGWWSSWCDLYEDYYHCHCCYKKWMIMTWPLQRLGSPHLAALQGVDLSWCPPPPFVQTVWKLSSFLPPERSDENHCSNDGPFMKYNDIRKAGVFTSHEWGGGSLETPKMCYLVYMDIP